MTYKEYSKKLEEVIERIPMAEHTKILVEAIVNEYKEQLEE